MAKRLSSLDMCGQVKSQTKPDSTDTAFTYIQRLLTDLPDAASLQVI